MDSLISHLIDSSLRAIADLESGRDTEALGVDELLHKLHDAIAATPTLGSELGPVFAKLMKAKNNSLFDPNIYWVSIGGGHMAVGKRPRFRDLSALKRRGVTHLLTLQGDREGAMNIGEAVRELGMQWLWLPLSHGGRTAPDRLPEIVELYERLRLILKEGGRLYVHCSAGIHRTGMISNGLLRFLGYSSAEARAILTEMRKLTGEEVGEDRIKWGEQFAPVPD